jgi:hypothetical protein
MMRKAAATCALLVLASCPAEETPVDPRGFLQEVFRASVACFPSFLGEAEPVFLTAKVDAELEVAVASFERNLDNENVTFVRAAYDRCLEAAKNDDCAVLDDDDGPCATVFRGELNVDEVCAEGTECAPGLSCFQDLDACGVCRPLAVIGDDCTASSCVDGAACDGTVCQPEPEPSSFAEGDLCSLASGCGGVVSGLVCIDGACAPITVVDEGDACEVGPTARLYCRNNTTTHTCAGGTCTARPGLGDACDVAGACDAREAACAEGTCVDEGHPGDACTNGLGCQLGALCKQGVCVALVDAPVPPTCE